MSRKEEINKRQKAIKVYFTFSELCLYEEDERRSKTKVALIMCEVKPRRRRRGERPCCARGATTKLVWTDVSSVQPEGSRCGCEAAVVPL